MRYLATPCTFVVLATLLLGCGTESFFSDASNTTAGSTGGVAVIDVDIVARELGRFDEIMEAVSKRELSLNSQLAEIQQSYQEQVKSEKVEIGPNPSGADVSRVTELEQQLTAQLTQAQKEARSELQQYKIGMINQFRDKVRPIAQQVASEKGLNVVVSKNDDVVFSFVPSVDVTAAVVALMQKTSPATDPNAPEPFVVPASAVDIKTR